MVQFNSAWWEVKVSDSSLWEHHIPKEKLSIYGEDFRKICLKAELQI